MSSSVVTGMYQEPKSDQLAPQTSPQMGGLQVLVVEDDVDCVESVSLLLRIHGHQVETASNGPKALAVALANPPDVVLLDIGLPGMCGYEVAKRLTEQATEKRPLIIAITGFGLDPDRHRSEEAGIDLHLVKPADPNALMALLGRFSAVLSR